MKGFSNALVALLSGMSENQIKTNFNSSVAVAICVVFSI